MKSSKQLGIFMDHSHANLMEYKGKIIDSSSLQKHGIDHGDRRNSDKGEYQIQTKEDTEQKVFYNKLGDVIKNFDEVVLFGPTQAKVELLNALRADHHFSHVKIEIKNSDKLTENQQHAFVKDYFEK
ncbi:MAG: hypothetical protein HYZ14_06835 [Bacteroidetes bacterium]|nr:hypothetical protein [Bacteroidota bacterium]